MEASKKFKCRVDLLRTWGKEKEVDKEVPT
jgi:hypothetical protein